MTDSPTKTVIILCLIGVVIFVIGVKLLSKYLKRKGKKQQISLPAASNPKPVLQRSPSPTAASSAQVKNSSAPRSSSSSTVAGTSSSSTTIYTDSSYSSGSSDFGSSDCGSSSSGGGDCGGGF